MSAIILKLYCYRDGKKDFLKWIEKYEAMDPMERDEEDLLITANRVSRSFCEPLSWWDRIKLKFMSKKNKSKIDSQLEWEDAFEYFQKVESEMMGDVYEKMGLSRNGFRPDDC